MSYLENVVSWEGSETGDDSIQAAADLPQAKAPKGTSIGFYVGAVNFARKSIPHFADVVERRVVLTHEKVGKQSASAQGLDGAARTSFRLHRAPPCHRSRDAFPRPRRIIHRPQGCE